MKVDRIVLIVLDSVGIGELPDAHLYGDVGSNTLANLARNRGGLALPNLAKLGLGNIHPITGVEQVTSPAGAYGKMAELSPGKDTTTGHWEMAGVILAKPFPTFPHGFPAEFLQRFEKAIGRGTIGNLVASGTEIIKQLGEEHMGTGKPIVYTSADSVFQIAAHEEIIPLQELYRICQIARDMLVGPLAVGRVIARPFLGSPGNFQRTVNRHDYAILPPVKILHQYIADTGREVMAVGKIKDIYAGLGITQHRGAKGNMDAMDQLLFFLEQGQSGFIMVNLVDFDMLYGHRNDIQGYAEALEQADSRIPEILTHLGPRDVLMITADHGCDPTTKSTDHSREYVPLMICGPEIKNNVNLGTRTSFADLGATIAELFGTSLPVGQSFAREILK
ncbi:MAG TPA: phosphopentomutase [Verrucomicrobiae bacterium]|nr:phosphopentomutase [Verrucomicrobiae bacterium]